MRKRAPAWRSSVGRKLKVHDRHQVELKLEYRPRPGERQSRYVVEAFICVPGSLNVGPDNVPSERLYADVHNYVRLKTPELSWSELGGLPTSPLVRLEAELEAVAAGGDARRLIYQAKLTACVFRANLRELASTFEKQSARLVDGGVAEVARLEDLVEEQLDNARSLLDRLRAVIERAQLPEVPTAALRLADEYISVSLEQYLRKIIVALSRARLAPAAHAAAAALKRALLDAILVEEKHRRARGYPSIIDPLGDNEPYVYRGGLLKKFCSSVLFLEIRRAYARRPWQELMFAIAAGIAMAFATIIAFWAQTRYSVVGMQLFLILVVGYMFKDRIKEGARGIFSRWLQRFWDRKIVIDDPAGGSLGTCNEKIHYVRKEDVPAEINELRARGLDVGTRLATLELDETVIHYKKELKLDAQRLEERGLTDILRFHVARLLHDMDEPDQEIEYIDETTQALGPVRAAKTYHVDLIFRVSAARRPPQVTLMRLILDRNGIRRIERTEAAPESSMSMQQTA